MEASVMENCKVCTFHSSLCYSSWFTGCESILAPFQYCNIICRQGTGRSLIHWKYRAAASNTRCNQWLSSRRYWFRIPSHEIMNQLLKKFQMCHFWLQASFLLCFLLVTKMLVDDVTICWSSPKRPQKDWPPQLSVSEPMVKAITVVHLIC